MPFEHLIRGQTQEFTESLHTIQVLLLKLIEQEQTAVRAESLSLELLQETLAEARAGRIGLWETLAVPALKEAGRDGQQIASLFEHQTDQAKNFDTGWQRKSGMNFSPAKPIRTLPSMMMTVREDSHMTIPVPARTKVSKRHNRIFGIF